MWSWQSYKYNSQKVGVCVNKGSNSANAVMFLVAREQNNMFFSKTRTKNKMEGFLNHVVYLHFWIIMNVCDCLSNFSKMLCWNKAGSEIKLQANPLWCHKRKQCISETNPQQNQLILKESDYFWENQIKVPKHIFELNPKWETFGLGSFGR